MSDFIWTKHARERAGLRSLSESDVELVLRHPDKTYPGKKQNTVKFIKTIQSRQVQVVASLVENKKWLIVSVWVRGEQDPVPLVWKIITLPVVILWSLVKLIVKQLIKSRKAR
jgi:hypothetical protein